MNTRLLALLILLPLSVFASEPAWWAQRGVKSAGIASNHSPANIGQAKWFAKMARDELNAHLTSFGAGTSIESLVGSFNTGVNNFSPINQGQLKAMAKLYYDRLLFAGVDTQASLTSHGQPGWAHKYPWTSDTGDDANYAPVTLGQLKWVFSFDLSGFSLGDGDYDDNTIIDGMVVITSGESTTFDTPHPVTITASNIPQGAPVPYIRYTLDGSLPTWESQGTAGTTLTITVFHDVTVKACLFWNPTTQTNVVSSSYNVLDSDQDGMPNDWEIEHSLDPDNKNDASGDADGDGLSNLREYSLGKNPNIVDTLGDFIVNFPMGNLIDGSSLRSMVMYSKLPDAALFTTAALQFDLPSSIAGLLERYPESGTIEQIRVPMAVIMAEQSTDMFTINYYIPSDVTWNSVSSRYSVNSGANSYMRYNIKKGETLNDVVIQQEYYIKQTAQTGDWYLMYEWLWSYETGVWDVYEGNETSKIRILDRTLLSAEGLSSRGERLQIKNDAGTVAEDTTRRYRLFGVPGMQQELLYKEIAHHDSTPAIDFVTEYDYARLEPSQETQRLKSIKKPDGGWEYFDYITTASDGNIGLLKHSVTPYLDETPNLPTDLTNAEGLITSYTYTNDWNNQKVLPLEIVSSVNTSVHDHITIHKSSYSYDFFPTTMVLDPNNPANLYRIMSEDENQYYGDGINDKLTTRTLKFRRKATDDINATDNVLFSDKTIYRQNADGTMKAYKYSRGTLTVGADLNIGNGYASFTSGIEYKGWRETMFTGVASTSGYYENLVQIAGTNNYYRIYLIPGKSTKTETYRDARGFVMHERQFIYVGSSWIQVRWTNFSYDETGRLLQRLSGTGSGASARLVYKNQYYTTGNYSGRLSKAIDDEGTITEFTEYDALGRLTKTKQLSATFPTVYGPTCSVPDILSKYSYDASGRTIDSGVYDDGTPGENIVNSSSYYTSGLLKQKTAPGDYHTNYNYSANGRTTTATFPNGSTKITNSYPDGKPESITGSAVLSQYYRYSFDTDGHLTVSHKVGSQTSTRYTDTVTDWLGREILAKQPAYNEVSAPDNYSYSHKIYDPSNGYLSTERLTDGPLATSSDLVAPTRYQYNVMGSLSAKYLDVNSNGMRDDGGSDRISIFDYNYKYVDSDYWLEETHKIKGMDANGNPVDVANTVQTKRTRLTFADDIYYRYVSYIVYIDVNGNKTINSASMDRFNKLSSSGVITYHPEGNVVHSKVYLNGLLAYTTAPGFVSNFAFYDNLGRIKQTHGRLEQDTYISYLANTTLVDEEKIGTALLRKTEYNSYGFPELLKNYSDATNFVSIRYGYDDKGRMIKKWGSAEYPVKYSYDTTYGQLQHQYTYRGGTGWETADTWPTTTGDADETHWVYHEPTGLITQKQDNNNNGETYSYDLLGRMKDKTTARTQSTATYSYDPSSGDLTRVNYSDNTPDLEFTYTRLGTLHSVTDATGLRTFTYRTTDYQQSKETLPTAFYGTRTLHNNYSNEINNGGYIGRPTSMSLQSDYTVLTEAIYGYDYAGRLKSVSSKGNTVEYTYGAKSELITQAMLTTAGTYDIRHEGIRNVYNYQSNRPWLDEVYTARAAGNASSYKYKYDELGRRTSEFKKGKLYDIYETGSGSGGNSYEGIVRKYTYNDHSEVASGEDFLNPNGNTTFDPAQATVPVTGRTYSYNYDNQGNRTTDGTIIQNNWDSDYVPTGLNQYSERSVPPCVQVSGSKSSATVSVNGTAATRHGPYYFSEVSAINTSSYVWSSITVNDGTTSTSSSYFTPKTNEEYAYDEDGNMNSDGRFTYTYDAENRLTLMTPRHDFQGNVKLAFMYDYLGRRVRKQVYTFDSSSSYVLTKDLKFIYDGWQMISEYDVLASANLRFYVWGLDKSGTVGGAGGVGGLLLIQDASTAKKFFVGYDGMGNVTTLINATIYSQGKVEAAYEYSPYGETLRAEAIPGESTTSIFSVNPFRFSTKYLDIETGNYDYGMRMYIPGQGRFLNRDPIGERGGQNLYGFCRNDPVNQWDVLGLGQSPGVRNPTTGGTYTINWDDNDYISTKSPTVTGTMVTVYLRDANYPNATPHPYSITSSAVGNILIHYKPPIDSSSSSSGSTSSSSGGSSSSSSGSSSSSSGGSSSSSSGSVVSNGPEHDIVTNFIRSYFANLEEKKMNLKQRGQAAFDELNRRGVPHEGILNNSCYNVNTSVMVALGPIPEGFSINLEYRIGPKWWLVGMADHYVAVAKAPDNSEMMFDYWKNRPAGESPDIWFRQRYPIPRPIDPDIYIPSIPSGDGHWHRFQTMDEFFPQDIKTGFQRMNQFYIPSGFQRNNDF